MGIYTISPFQSLLLGIQNWSLAKVFLDRPAVCTIPHKELALLHQGTGKLCWEDVFLSIHPTDAPPDSAPDYAMVDI